MDLIVALQDSLPASFDGLAMLLTNLGSEQVYVALIVLTFVTFSAKAGRRIAIYFLIGVFLMELLKALFNEPRPFQLDPSVLRVPAAEATAGGPSFPSGHALSAMLFWALAASYVRNGLFTAVAAVVVLLVGVTRVYLGVHFPRDVLVGFALGLLFALLGRLIDQLKWPFSRGVIIGLGLLLPLTLQLLLPTENSGLYLGAVAAFVIGVELVPHRTDGPLPGRALLGLLGLVLVFGALMGSSALIPDELRHSRLGSFARYLLVGGVGTVLVPLLGRWLRLVPTGRPPGYLNRRA